MTLVVCRSLTVSYGSGTSAVTALSEVDLAIAQGETVAMLGRSGSGKTTLLHVLGGLVPPTSGTVAWDGSPRPSGVAFVFQGANLLPHFTALENVMFATLAADGDADPLLAAPALLELVGLSRKADHLPAELSGGEAQRVAIARALAQTPRLLLCDEPTGHLDSDTGERMLELIEVLQREFGFALVIATHDVDIAARLPRQVEMHDGRLVQLETAA